MKNDKQYYKNLENLPNGFKWAFYDKTLHSFIKKVNGQFLEVKVNDNDIETNNHIIMMEKGFSR